MSYSFGGKANYSYLFDVMKDSSDCYRMPKVWYSNEQALVECFHHRKDGWSESGYIDRGGKLYILINTTLNLIAENIEELWETEAVKYSLLRKQKQWITKSMYESEVTKWLENAKPSPILLTQASQGQSNWWRTQDDRFYVHTYNGRGSYAEAYAREFSDLQKQDLNSYLLLGGFPFSCYPYPEKECAEMAFTKEMYHFRGSLYHTSDYTRVKVPQVKEANDIYLYMTGQKEYDMRQRIEEFILKMPELEISVEDYDTELIEFALQSGDGMILKLISYLASADELNRRRTAAETNVDWLLFKEYLRRICSFIEKHPTHVHPLYFHPYQVAGVPIEFDIDDYYVLKRMNEYSNARSISNRTLYYMKCAKEGNTIAAEIYRVYEPLLLFYCLGGYITKEHGFISVGNGTIHQSSWQAVAGKEPIHIYDSIAEAWENRNGAYAIDQINRIRWGQKSGKLLGQSVYSSKEDKETIHAAFTRLESKLGVVSSDHTVSFERSEPFLSKVFVDWQQSCSGGEGTIAYLICERYLAWARLLDQKHPIATKIPCLYEPFIEMLREEDQMDKWERKTIELIALMEKEPMENYAEVIRRSFDDQMIAG
ncbi:hypothetical protein [Brevibacillus sp. 179-C 1.1 NHS]|uniref:hypothetical protein n=1 Tax=Brevibacillus sp. 179-C 1.1 NHS TaxID=3235177 RepID=UPI0039A29613